MPATTVDEIYTDAVLPLPAADRLQLVARILRDLPQEAVDEDVAWSDEDLRDWSRAGWVQMPDDSTNTTLSAEQEHPDHA